MNKYIFALAGIAVLVLGLKAGAHIFAKPVLAQPEHALYYKNARDIKAFELTDHQGEKFTQDSFKGQWSWVFFGYTSCPHICAPTLNKFNGVYEELKAIDKNNSIFLVSVDPKRDSLEALSDFVGHFNEEFVALRGEHDALFPFARNLGLMYAMTDDEETDEPYMVDHSASIVLVNPEGKIAAIFKPEHEVGEMPIVSTDILVSDFEKINALYSD